MKRLIAVLMTSVLLMMLSATNASAAKQSDFFHAGWSEKANMLVYHGYTCKNNASTDFVPRGDRAHIDVGAVWVVKGVSLWYVGTNGKVKRAAKKSSKSRCVTLINYANQPRFWGFRNGNNWGAG